jgi:hypothetical protein
MRMIIRRSLTPLNVRLSRTLQVRRTTEQTVYRRDDNSPQEVQNVRADSCAGFLNDTRGLTILRSLQVCIGHEVHGVDVRRGGTEGCLVRPIDSCHIPNIENTCDGMWRACGAEGATFAYRSATDSPRAASEGAS